MNDDKKLKQIESEYGSGRMLTGEAKAELVKVSELHDSSTHTAHCCAAFASNIMTQWQPICLKVIDLLAHRLLKMVHAWSSLIDTVCQDMRFACVQPNELSKLNMQTRMVHVWISKTCQATALCACRFCKTLWPGIKQPGPW